MLSPRSGKRREEIYPRSLVIIANLLSYTLLIHEISDSFRLNMLENQAVAGFGRSVIFGFGHGTPHATACGTRYGGVGQEILDQVADAFLDKPIYNPPTFFFPLNY